MSESQFHTQAGNFLNFLKTGVDARTGQFTLAVALPLPPANQLCGPTMAITLAFSMLGSTNNRGYGAGWSLGLSEVNLDQTSPRLSLGSGEQFAIDLNRSSFEPGQALQFFDQKLNTLKVTPQTDGSLRVDKISGECEILRKQQANSARYMLEEMRSPEGRRLYFTWLPHGDDDFILETVRDEQRALLSVANGGADVTLTLNPQSAISTALTLSLSNDQLTAIALPGLANPFQIEYSSVSLGSAGELQLPTRVTSPLGASDSIHWAEDSNGHQLPEGAAFSYLPRVSLWTHSSGNPSTELNHTYQWIGDHNYLGFGSDQTFDWQAGRDNLYEVNSEYQYQGVETLTDGAGQPLGTIDRTWNRFHLLVSESTRKGACETRNTTAYGMDPALTWEQQPAWCQLPREVSTTYIDHAAKGASRTETTTYQYDDHGNIIHTRHPTGVEEFTTYFPAEGAEGCPPDPLGMVRFIKRKTTHPAKPSGDAPILSKAYTYQALASLIEGEPAHIVIASESLIDEQDGRVLEHTRKSFVTTPGPTYGREQQSVTTLNGKATLTQREFTLTDDELISETHTVGFEQDEENRSNTASAQCLHNAQTVWTRSESGVVTRHEYDAIGRIVRTINALNSPFQTEQLVRYHLGDEVAKGLLANAAELPLVIEQVEVTGQRQRFWLDGDGRTLRIEMEDLDQSPGLFRETGRNTYDALGRLTAQAHQDWLSNGAAEPQVSTTTTVFDDWGQDTLSISAEGVTTHLKRNPVTQRSKQWQEAGGMSGPRLVVVSNTAGSPVEQQHHDAEGNLVRTLKLMRDGLDRVIEEQLVATDMPPRTTRMRYDHYSRVVEKHLADGTMLTWQFAAHSNGQHPESITVTAATQEQQP